MATEEYELEQKSPTTNHVVSFVSDVAAKNDEDDQRDNG